jgi:hypothetical protein
MYSIGSNNDGRSCTLSRIYCTVYVLMWFSHPHVCDQLLWINGYSFTHAFLLRGGPNTSSNFISICIIKIFPTLPVYEKYFWPGSVISHGVEAGGRWRVLTQQADEQLNFEWYRQKLLAGKEKENSQIFNEDFYLPLYLPLWGKVTSREKGRGAI